ncbi:DNA-invertase hin [Xanthomonas sacchari]|uniref:DNA-invertase hin n=1 Tax=Xanthomonas sacchari TaxID=56458 RepID=A0ABT3DTI7_9XANT|nr:recombinase family protein [Xanthomonas sacchari]MCW0398821.1 DNA-invertase hin [Xanthomonas sacchari]MCW0418469.1 DNA-invertase hin [Xanthomonas sacchari]UYK72472.1 recombinase family protein [Xanthomonas sacchari]
MKKIGYARVSTDEQNLSLQVRDLERAGCDLILTDQGISGATRKRPGLDRALEILQAGDKLVVWRLDRLGRSLVHMVHLLDHLGERQVSFRSLNEQIDTGSSSGRLVFHMMAALAEFERSLISERTRAGMAAARAEGRKLGRLPALDDRQCVEALRLIDDEGQSLRNVAARYRVHPRTLIRGVNKLRESALV